MANARSVRKDRRGSLAFALHTLAGERERFLKEDWPQILAVINRLGFSSQELFAQTPALTHPAPPPRGSVPTEE